MLCVSPAWWFPNFLSFYSRKSYQLDYHTAAKTHFYFLGLDKTIWRPPGPCEFKTTVKARIVCYAISHAPL